MAHSTHVFCLGRQTATGKGCWGGLLCPKLALTQAGTSQHKLTQADTGRHKLTESACARAGAHLLVQEAGPRQQGSSGEVC